MLMLILWLLAALSGAIASVLFFMQGNTFFCLFMMFVTIVDGYFSYKYYKYYMKEKEV